MFEQVISREDFDKGAFQIKGGYKVINEKIFGGELEKIITLINKTLYNVSA